MAGPGLIDRTEGCNPVVDIDDQTTDLPPQTDNNSSGGGGLPAKPITGEATCWLPRIATAGCLGLTLLRACRNRGLRGSSALAWPLFGTEAKERLFATYMAGNLTSPLMIWTLEEMGGYESHGGWTPGHAISLWKPIVVGGALHHLGIDIIAPLYFLSVVLPLQEEDPKTASQKIDPDVARAILPATLIGHVVPSLLMSALPMTFTEVSRSPYGLQWLVCHAFLFSPITVPILTYSIATAKRWYRDTAELRAPAGQREKRDESDESCTVGGRLKTPILKEAYWSVFSIQAVGQILAAASLASQSWSLWGNLSKMALNQPNALAKAQAVLKWVLEPMSFTCFEMLSLYAAATATFGLYTVWDLRRRGYTTSRQAKRVAVGYLAGNILVGPGASYAGLWMWRECVMASLQPGV